MTKWIEIELTTIIPAGKTGEDESGLQEYLPLRDRPVGKIAIQPGSDISFVTVDATGFTGPVLDEPVLMLDSFQGNYILLGGFVGRMWYCHGDYDHLSATRRAVLYVSNDYEKARKAWTQNIKALYRRTTQWFKGRRKPKK